MTLLIEPAALSSLLSDGRVRVIDARFSLQDPGLGWQQFLEGHIPGAVYADLAQDMSGQVIPGVTGRHPLPDPTAFAERLQSWGVTKETRVVIYDESSHAMAAARCWWLLEWAGLTRVKILHGGFNVWVAAGMPLSFDVNIIPHSDYCFKPRSERVVVADDLHTLKGQSVAVIDARPKIRFSGLEEPIDPVGGHIPDSVCLPFSENMDEKGRFLEPEALAERFQGFYPKSSEDESGTPVCYCGSGVTACHNILAMRIAGLPWPRLYPGSWSEWITDPSRSVVTGDK